MAGRRPGALHVGFQGTTAIRLLAQGDWSSAIADIATVWAVRQQCGGLPTVVPSSNPMAASCNSELTLPSRFRRRAFAAPIRYAIYMRPEDGQPFGMDAKRSHPEELKK
ncbi:hypothetical protein [Paraburkholderia sp. MM5496-R1]|uniref:hypothetical protein n=1 Tax=unclassified Paraburkholderia TaxID=2615204 RepID=UPI003D1EF0D3